MRVETVTPVLDAAPGELVVGRVRILNDGDVDAVFTMRVVGLDGAGVMFEVPGGAVGPGDAAEVDVPLEVPAALGVGQHPVALEVSSDQPDERPALARLTVSVDSIERVQLAPSPSTVRGGRKARFTLDLVNNEPAPVDIALSGGGPDVDIDFEPPNLRLRSGERGWVRGHIRAKRRWSGESVHHVLEVDARGRSSTASTTVAYLQRPTIPGSARNFVAGLVVVALFLTLIGGGLWWWSQRDTGADTEVSRSADGTLEPVDGTAGEPGDGGGTGGGGGGGTGGGDAGGDDGGDDGADGDDGDEQSGPDAIPTFTVVTGTVSVAGGDSSGVTVRLAPIDLGGDDPDDPDDGGDDGAGGDDASIVALAGRSKQSGKLWSARHATRPSAVSPVRETESVPPVTTDEEGVWRFGDVPIRGTYELVFSKEGYGTRSFVVTPPDDGSEVEIEVEMEPGTGELAGTVVGPDGPLGGVELTLSDGDLEFSTTSATAASGAGEVGSFALEQLSTPAVYTLTAELRGFGTEVVQLPFDAGDNQAGVVVQMREGVGAISGRITSGAEPRGGVTVTASNGDDTFTTTSLTEGDVGFYSIPRLEIPGSYTVTASVDGFIAETRRVQLQTNADGVDFELVPTTAAITGEVVSDNGNPIVGAGVTVSIDDISVRSSTAAEPVPGVFNVDELPPGTYLVRISRFDHLPFAQQVTVGAGEIADLGTIELQFTDRPPIPALGSVAVNVLDSEEQELEGATVELYAVGADPGTDEPLRSISDDADEQSSFVFENVPVGTYRVRVTRPIYRTFERRISVGLGRESIEARLLRLGQASGQIVTPDGQPLRDYEISIFRVDGPDQETFIESRVVPLGAEAVDGAILWESEPNSLVTGLYRLEVTRQPAGYQVEPDQVVDPTVTETPAAMLFRVPADSEEPVRVDDLVADPFPLLGGRLFRPVLDTTDGTTSLEPFDEADVVALPGLEIVLTCGSETGQAVVPPDPDRAQIRPYPGFSLEAPANHFEFTPFLLQASRLTGDCVLDITADGYLDTTVPLASPIAPAPGVGTPQQRTVNVALVEEVDPFFGTVLWEDGADRIPVAGVDIESDDDTVIATAPRQGNAFGDTVAPRLDRAAITDESDAAGDWQLDGQLYGSSDYTFTDPRFGDAIVRVVIDDDGRVVTSADPATGAVESRGDGGFDVLLADPVPGPLRGQVQILTTGTPAFDDVGIAGEGPGTAVAPSIEFVPGAAGNPRPFELADAAAGTWEVGFELPDNHAFFGGAPDVLTQRVEPLTGVDGVDTAMVELAELELDVELNETAGAPQPSNGGGYELRDPSSTSVSSGSFDTTVNVDEIPVHPTNPVTVPLVYALDVTQEGYDESAATVEIDTQVGPGAGPGSTTGTSSTDVALDLYAGSDASITVTLDQYGTITGTVLGRAFGDTVLHHDDGLLEVDAVPVDVNGDPLPADPRVLVYGTDDEATSFVVTGPPGTYDITVSHPAYEPDPIEVPLDDVTGDPLQFPLTNLQPGDEDDPWVLRALTSTLELTALGSFGPPDGSGADPERVQLDDARVTISRPSDPDFDDIVVATDANGEVSVGDLVPGTYRVEVRRFENHTPGTETTEPTWSGDDISYPVIAELTVPGGTTEAERTLSIEVKLPSLTGSITGTLTAQNSAGEPVAAPSPVTIDRVYEPLGVEVVGDPSGTTIPNEADDTTPAPALSATEIATVAAVGDLENDYAFDRVPGGQHELTFEVPAGYSLVASEATQTVNVDDVVDGDDQTVDVGYAADDVDVAVELDYLSSASVGDPSVRLEHADGDTITLTPDADEPLVFTAPVPPRSSPYDLVVNDDPLAQPSADSPTTVDVQPRGDVLEVAVEMVPKNGVITGNVQQQADTGSPGNLQGEARIVLTRGSARTFVDDIDVADGESRGSFTFEIDQGGTYYVTIEKDGYVSTEPSAQANPGSSVSIGTVSALAEHTFEIQVDSDPGTSVTAVPLGGSPAVTGTRVDDLWTFGVPPDTEYRFRADRAGHYTTVLPAPGDSFSGPDIPIGGTTARTVTLVERLVEVDVSGPNSPSSGSPVAVTADMVMGGTTFSRAANAPTSGDTELRFRSTDDPAISLTEAATEVTVSAPGHRTQVLSPNGSWPIAGFGSTEIAPSVTAADRTETLSVTLRPDVTSIEGGVTGTTEQVEVRVFDGGTEVAGPVTTSGGSDNTYVVSGSFDPGTYTVRASELGVGAGEEDVTIDAVSPTGAIASPPDIAIAARDVDMTVTVNGPDPADVEIRRDGTVVAGLTTTTADDVTFTVPETDVVATYEVRADGRVWDSFEVSSVPSDLTFSTTITLAEFPAITGTVSDADGTVESATVELHLGACPPDDELRSVTTDGDGDYPDVAPTAGGVAGDHCVFAEEGSLDGEQTLTVAANGTLTGTTDITIS